MFYVPSRLKTSNLRNLRILGLRVNLETSTEGPSMSLWQGSRWTTRQSQSTPQLQVGRLSLSGNSSAATSTVSLVSSSSAGNVTPPRRPLNQLNLRLEQRRNSTSRSKTGEVVKSDHDPLKTLVGILGEIPQETRTEEFAEEANLEMKTAKVDAGGKTLEAWLDELEKGKLSRLSKDIARRISPALTVTNLRNECTQSIHGIADVNHSRSRFL